MRQASPHWTATPTPLCFFVGLGSCNANNTWTWDGTNWTEMSAGTQPSLRYNSAGAYEPGVQAVVVFGGGSGGMDLNDTWSWNGAAWQAMAPAQSPPRRESFGIAYDEAGGAMLMFGGQRGEILFGDTWKLTMH